MRRGLAGAAALIAVLTLASRVVGFGRWLVYSHSVSGLCVGNAYSAANQVPNVLYEVVAGGALAGAVVPLLAGPLSRARDRPQEPVHRADADRISSALLTWTLLVLTPIAVLLAALAHPLAAALVDEAGCPGATDLAARFLRVFAPQIVLYGLGVVLTGILTARHLFVGPALGPLVSSLVVIGAYLGFSAAVGPSLAVRDDAAALPAVGEAWLAWGTTAGVAVMTVPLLVPVLRAGSRIRPVLRFPDGVAARARSLALAGIAALLAQQASVVAVLIVQRNSGEAATLNVFQYTQAVYLLPYAVLVVPLATASFPRLAERAAAGDLAGFSTATGVTTRVVLLVSLAGAALLVAVAAPVADFFGHLDRADVSSMAPALAAMAPGLIGFGLIAHLGRALYALERGRVAAQATVAGWVVVVVGMLALATVLPGRVAAVALGLGTSLGMTVAAVGLLVGVHRATAGGATRGLARGVSCMLPGALLGALTGGYAGVWLLPRTGDSLVGALTAGVGAASVCGIVMVAALAVLDRDDLVVLLRRRRGSGGA